MLDLIKNKKTIKIISLRIYKFYGNFLFILTEILILISLLIIKL
jgi:hypothetical protein